MQRPVSAKPKGQRFLPKLVSAEIAATEDTLSKHEGRIFDFRRKHSESSGDNKTLLVDDAGNQLTLKWDREFGRPNTTAYLLLQALFHKSTREGHPFTDTVSFHQQELWKLMGRDEAGGQQNKHVYAAIKQLAGIELTGKLYNPETKLTHEQSIRIFSEQRFIKDERGHIKLGVLHWSPYIVRGMNAGYWHAFNYDRIKGAGAVEFALYKQLHFHFSNLAAYRVWDLKKAGRDTPDNIARALASIDFKKDIDDLFTSFFGGIQAPKYLAHIRAKYGTQFDDLVERGIIANWKVEKNAAGDGHNFIVRAGKPFAQDWVEMNSTKTQPRLKWDNAREQSAIVDPMGLVVFFHQTLSGVQDLDRDSFHANEFAFATELIEKRSAPEAQDFIAWAVAHARKTKYGVRQLDGLRFLVNDWLKVRQHAERERAQREKLQHRRRLDDDKDAHAIWLQQQAQQALDRLAPDERAAMGRQVRAELANEKIPPQLQERFIQLRLVMRIKERLDLPTFEQWRARTDR